jgi:MerR family transcriptional regulator, copper efflux regulator
MSTYQIADVAERSGFTPATLRYYEDIGLMAPAGRTPAGYRVYDDASLERLRFIARAKQLGCTLDEITDLATAWDGGECGPLQDRLRAAVEAKISEAHGRIAELTAFAADLQRAAATLAGHRPEGPCDDDCGCTTNTTLANDGVEHPPIACTLGAGEMSTRLDEWNAILEEKRDLLRGRHRCHRAGPPRCRGAGMLPVLQLRPGDRPPGHRPGGPRPTGCRGCGDCPVRAALI